MLFIFYNYILHFIFQYITLIKQNHVILMHCQLYIKVLLSYSLNTESRELKHVAAMFFQLYFV